MTRFFMSVALFSFGFHFAQAQYAGKGSKDLNVGTGFGSSLYSKGATVLIPPISASLDIGVHENISVGGYASFTASRWRPSGLNNRYNETHATIGLRGAYHFDLYVENLDTYAGVLVGFSLANSSWRGPGIPTVSSPALSRSAYSLFGGARYLLSEKIGIFAEIGYGVTFLQVGMTIKL